MSRVELQEVVVTGEPGGAFLRPRWPVAVILATIALSRTIFRIIEHASHTQAHDRMSLAITLVVSLVWIVVLAVRRNTPAVPTLVAAGLIQAAADVVVMFVATWIIDGVPGGPLVRPAALLLTLGGGALWGLVCGAVALALQNARQGIADPVGKPSEPSE